MPDASTPDKRFSRVRRDFETSRLEKALLAAAYECAVPAASRRVRRKACVPSYAVQASVAPVEMDFQTSLATERQAG
jgi:hypothetical protein